MQPATIALVAINVIIALVDGFSHNEVSRLGWSRGIDIQYGQYWRIFTGAWVHANLLHIGFNAYGIYVLGTIVERLHGWKPMLIVYFVSLFGGSCLAMAFMDPAVPLLGASGAAYGLFGAVLGFFYAKTGNFRGLLKIPMARMLLIWLAFGVYMSLQPGISLLGHLGGFVSGAILGTFFEHRYQRQLDIYHILSVALVGVAIVGLGAFACFPFSHSSWYATRAMRAYEAGDMQRGDDLLKEAKKHNHSRDGAKRLLDHLDLWRKGHSVYPDDYNNAVLRWPLTHPQGIESGRPAGQPFSFLLPVSPEEPSESLAPTQSPD